MLVFEERGKPEYPEKTSWRKGENQQQTQPTYGADAGMYLNPGHIGGRRVLVVKSLRHVAMVATFLGDNKPKRHLKCGFALFQTSSSLLNFI